MIRRAVQTPSYIQVLRGSQLFDEMPGLEPVTIRGVRVQFGGRDITEADMTFSHPAQVTRVLKCLQSGHQRGPRLIESVYRGKYFPTTPKRGSGPEPIAELIENGSRFVEQGQCFWVASLASPYVREAPFYSRTPPPVIHAVEKLDGAKEILFGFRVTTFPTAQVAQTMQERPE
jgi:hypothetical protein